MNVPRQPGRFIPLFDFDPTDVCDSIAAARCVTCSHTFAVDFPALLAELDPRHPISALRAELRGDVCDGPSLRLRASRRDGLEMRAKVGALPATRANRSAISA